MVRRSDTFNVFVASSVMRRFGEQMMTNRRQSASELGTLNCGGTTVVPLSFNPNPCLPINNAPLGVVKREKKFSELRGASLALRSSQFKG